ncbi:MAG: ribonuclease III [Sandaracinaceae bacterium]|nr:ribonuclease III [Sandaracinaceae bacterium]
MPDDSLTALAEAIGHRFVEQERLLDAVTHRSFRNERPDLARADNERMELLGDAVVDLAASILLFEQHPDADEGELSRRRADLVCERTLAEIARRLSIGEHLRLGRGEEKSGGRDKPRLLASALEACVAAVYLDAGVEPALAVARALLEDAGELPPAHRDHKSKLQEVLQAGGSRPPTYEIVAQEGPEHARTFHVRVCVDQSELGEGRGTSKLRAEQDAARVALERIEHEPA